MCMYNKSQAGKVVVESQLDKAQVAGPKTFSNSKVGRRQMFTEKCIPQSIHKIQSSKSNEIFIKYFFILT